MSIITFKQTGGFSKTLKFLNHILKRDYLNILDEYGRKGIQILKNATPKDTGLTADSWTYEITSDRKTCRIAWFNKNNVSRAANGKDEFNKNGYEFNVVILLVYGHATRNGGWVEPNDFITPAMQPLLDKLAMEAWGAIIED